MTLDTARPPRPPLYNSFDYFGNPVITNDVKSYLDSLGRLILMWIAYGFPKDLAEQIEIHLTFEKRHLALFRHPGTWDKTSRDHWSYFIIYRRFREILPQYPDTWHDFNLFIKGIPKMRGITTWKKALANHKKAEFKYYRTGIPGAKIGNQVLKALNYLGKFEDEKDNQEWIGPAPWNWDIPYGSWLQINRTPWQNFISRAILAIIPAFALHNKAWQIYVMPDSPQKIQIQEILLKRVGKSNLVVRLLLNDRTVTLREIRLYPDMSNYRPGVYLHAGCRRDIRRLTERQALANNFEKQLVIMLWIKQAA